MKINSLYRYPIKSFTGEKKESVEINDLGKIIGDRIGAFRLGEDRGNYDKWLKKTNYLSLMHVPYLALIKIKFDENLEKISLKIPDYKEVKIHISEKEQIENMILKFLSKFNFEKQFKLILPSNSETSFHDTKLGHISLHSTESIKELNNKISNVKGIRFRSNFIIDGCAPFEEFSFIGKKISIGELEFKVEKTITRCAAVNCDPNQGTYNKSILKTLPELNGIKEPSFGVRLKLISKGGLIKTKDLIELN